MQTARAQSLDLATVGVGMPLAACPTIVGERARLADGIVLALGLALLLVWPLLSPPIGHHGEAREGLVVQDIVANGDWILPRRNGELPSKPPLFHWLGAVSTRTFGASDASLRLPSAFAALVVALVTYALGVGIGGRRVGVLAGAILIGMVPFLSAASEARVDMVFTAALTVALTGFFFWDARGARWGRMLYWGGVAAAVLAKGPAGAVIAGAVIGAFLLVDRRPAAIRTLWHGPLVLVVVVVVAGWYGLAARDGGPAFLRLQLVHENLERIAGSPSFHHSGHHHAARLPFALVGGFLPWSLAIVWAGIARLRGVPFDGASRFLHTWWLVVLLLFSASAGQRPVYLLPAAPAVALLAARFISDTLGARDGATSWLARLTPPAALQRRFPDHPRFAMIALAIVALDVAALVAMQAVRLQRGRGRSLAAFGDTVRRTVPPGAPLFAARTLGRNEKLLLAYRAAHPIAPEGSTPQAGAYYLVPVTEGPERSQRGATLLGESARDRGPNVALFRVGD